MLISTAQDVASIQYPAQVEQFFGENRRYELPHKPYTVRLSENRLENLIRTPSFISPRWSASPADCSFDEMLDWDYFAGPDPERPSGTISVTLEYVGRLVPENIEDIWD